MDTVKQSQRVQNHSLKEVFRRFAHQASEIMGSPWLFLMALLIVIIWALTGSLFDYSNSWQLIINTGTTIVTFLMVFVIQNTQNRDAHAMHLKLDELLRSVKEARNDLINLENCSDDQLSYYEEEFKRLRDGRERRTQARGAA